MTTVLAGEEEVKGERLMEEVFSFHKNLYKKGTRRSAGGGTGGILLCAGEVLGEGGGGRFAGRSYRAGNRKCFKEDA